MADLLMTGAHDFFLHQHAYLPGPSARRNEWSFFFLVAVFVDNSFSLTEKGGEAQSKILSLQLRNWYYSLVFYSIILHDHSLRHCDVIVQLNANVARLTNYTQSL